eukprot:CAMPEP_0204492068 /NCGR_PEP_ID=MMETSP0471-20130131/78820_1 /ASSEMBLY_ACC=CAM_ASM_000602 /TAXON_ID=2969 /ORGANISM="Oxyrrhis marina" /LENGTH=86 /DNA_ID=CAMNT_0051496105 /DNA_START=129 /DNA_END=390 /DNA_ORIENTATION=-
MPPEEGCLRRPVVHLRRQMGGVAIQASAVQDFSEGGEEMPGQKHSDAGQRDNLLGTDDLEDATVTPESTASWPARGSAGSSSDTGE